jgi:hypothetical protein
MVTRITEPVKQGASFSLPIRLHPVVAGTAVAELSDWVVTSQLRREDGRIVTDLTAAWIDVGQRVVLLSATPTETASWPTASLELDVVLTSPDQTVRIPSATLILTVAKAITK